MIFMGMNETENQSWGDNTFPKNKRGCKIRQCMIVCLLNVEYKTFTKVLTMRLEMLMNILTKCFIKGEISWMDDVIV
jgi:hypothetical protein